MKTQHNQKKKNKPLATLIHLPNNVYGCFNVVPADLSSCGREYIACKAENIYYLDLSERKKFVTCGPRTAGAIFCGYTEELSAEQSSPGKTEPRYGGKTLSPSPGGPEDTSALNITIT